ncbi:hypothetical protein PFISCL1PPCAC_8906, partial [Pristionchus fissidentatus]
EFKSICDHEHTGSCKECTQVDTVVQDFIELASKHWNDKIKAKDDMRHRMKRVTEMAIKSQMQIKAFQSHVMRTVVSETARSSIISNLTNGEALVTLDFAQKILPKLSIEPQSAFYGKKGISLHVTHVLVKFGSKLYHHSFGHIIDNPQQGGSAVAAIIRHVLPILEKQGVKKVHFRSDNAGNLKKLTFTDPFQ